jgi:hypothetical protein
MRFGSQAASRSLAPLLITCLPLDHVLTASLDSPSSIPHSELRIPHSPLPLPPLSARKRNLTSPKSEIVSRLQILETPRAAPQRKSAFGAFSDQFQPKFRAADPDFLPPTSHSGPKMTSRTITPRRKVAKDFPHPQHPCADRFKQSGCLTSILCVFAPLHEAPDFLVHDAQWLESSFP